MTSSEPVDPRVRLAISLWPDDAPRGAVSTFCLEHDISRKTFYAIRRRVIYNTERPHQGLPGRVTPQTAWQATAKAEAPRPKHDRPPQQPQPAPATIPDEVAENTRVMRLNSNGVLRLRRVHYKVAMQHASKQVLVIEDGDTITIADTEGTILIEHTRPAPGTRYVGNSQPRGRKAHAPPTSPMS